MPAPILFACAAVFVAGPIAAEFSASAPFVAAAGANAVLELSPIGTVAATLAPVGLGAPGDLAFAPDGHLYVAATGADVVVELAPGGAVVRQIGAGAGLTDPAGLAFGPDGDLYVTSADQDLVFRFDRAGDLVDSFGDGGLDQPAGIVFGPDGNLFVSAFAADRVLEFTPGGQFVRALGEGSALDGPSGIALSPTGLLVVASAENGRLIAFDQAGVAAQVIGLGSGLSQPVGVAFGPDQLLYVSDRGSGAVRTFSSSGALQGTLASGIDEPTAVAFGPSRLKVQLKGSAVPAGSAKVAIVETAQLTLVPGSRLALLAFAEDTGPEGLAAEFGSAWLVCSGFSAALADISTKRSLQAHGVREVAGSSVVTSLSLALKGSLDAANRLAVTSATGTLLHSGTDLAISLSVKSTKVLK